MKKLTQQDFMRINIFNIEKSIERAAEKTSIDLLTTKSKGNIVWMRYCLPYQVVKLNNGKMLFLNRGYQPLFLFSEGSTETLPPDYQYINRDECSEFAFDTDLPERSFYNDETVPWDSTKNLINYIKELKPYLV
jgi:hypothetical protein